MMDDFSPQDRERVMELLLSQERVISLLYSKTFPLQHQNQEAGGALGGGSDQSARDAVE